MHLEPSLIRTPSMVHNVVYFNFHYAGLWTCHLLIVSIDTLTSASQATVTYSVVSVIVIVTVLFLLLLLLLLLLWKRHQFSKKKSHTIEIPPQKNEYVVTTDFVRANEDCAEDVVLETGDLDIEAAGGLEKPEEKV